MPQPPLVLASSSPRRQALLAGLGLTFDVDAPEVDETPLPGEDPVDYVVRVACDKSVTSSREDGVVVLGADTAVVVDGRILGKPSGSAEARAMLALIADRQHTVLSGVALARGGRVAAHLHVETTVTMTPISEEEADWYISTGEPLDKAGAYAIQGIGGVFVKEVHGSVSNVTGLPLAETIALLREVGFEPLATQEAGVLEGALGGRPLDEHAGRRRDPSDAHL